jgi:hypothetical protein
MGAHGSAKAAYHKVRVAHGSLLDTHKVKEAQTGLLEVYTG